MLDYISIALFSITLWYQYAIGFGVLSRVL